MSVVKVFEDIDMRLGITGLTEYMRVHKTKAHDPNDMFMFINKRKTSVKIIWREEFCLHLRKSERITLEDLRAIPKFFLKGFLPFKAEHRAAEILGKTYSVKAVS